MTSSKLRRSNVLACEHNLWLNDFTLNLMWVCWCAEHKWLRAKLQVSYDNLWESLLQYQVAVKAARSYFIYFNTSCHFNRKP